MQDGDDLMQAQHHQYEEPVAVWSSIWFAKVVRRS